MEAARKRRRKRKRRRRSDRLGRSFCQELFVGDLVKVSTVNADVKKAQALLV